MKFPIYIYQYVFISSIYKLTLLMDNLWWAFPQEAAVQFEMIQKEWQNISLQDWPTIAKS